MYFFKPIITTLGGKPQMQWQYPCKIDSVRRWTSDKRRHVSSILVSNGTRGTQHSSWWKSWVCLTQPWLCRSLNYVILLSRSQAVERLVRLIQKLKGALCVSIRCWGTLTKLSYLTGWWKRVWRVSTGCIFSGKYHFQLKETFVLALCTKGTWSWSKYNMYHVPWSCRKTSNNAGFTWLLQLSPVCCSHGSIWFHITACNRHILTNSSLSGCQSIY